MAQNTSEHQRSAELLRTPYRRSSVAGISSVLCMLDYASPILYIRSPAAYGRGCAEFPSIPLPRTRVNKALRRTLRGVEQHRFALKLYRLSSIEYPPGTVFGPHGDVGVGGLYRHGRLESVSGNRA